MKTAKRSVVVWILSLLVALAPVPASAILPQFIGAVLYYGGTAEFAGALLASAATVASVIGFAHIKSPDASSPQLSVQIAPTAPLVVPPGWTGGDAGGDSMPPLTATGTPGLCYSAFSVCYLTAVAWAAARSAGDATYNFYITTGADPSWGFYGCYDSSSSQTPGCNGYFTSGVTATTVLTCPAGYTDSAGNCVLSNAQVVQKPSDSSCGVKRVGNTFTYDSRDPDCSALPPGVTVSSSAVTVQGSDGSTSTISIDSGTGVVTAQQSTPNVGGTTTSTSATVANSSGATALVTGVNTSMYQGQGTLIGTSPLSGFPTDYNRESTQQNIKSGIDQLNNKLDPTGVDTGMTGAKGQYDAAVAAHKSAIQSLADNPLNNYGIGFSFSPLIPASSCYEPSVVFPGGHSVTFAWCDKLAILKEILAWAFFVLTGFGIYNMVTREA